MFVVMHKQVIHKQTDKTISKLTSSFFWASVANLSNDIHMEKASVFQNFGQTK